MTQAAAPAKDNRPDGVIRYLLRADDDERKKWGERAVALGFSKEELRTRSTIFDLVPWAKFVENEMLEQGLIRPPDPEPEAEKPTAKIIQLPLWPEPIRAVPNDILRSALFAAIQGKTRRFMKNEVIASVDGVVINFTGEQLDQSDRDVWDQSIHLMRLHPLGTECSFTGGSFLRLLGRTGGKSDYEWLKGSLRRLLSCSIEIKCGKKIIGAKLLAGYKIDEETKAYKITIDKDIQKLYAEGWTGIDIEQRQQLRGKPLALWLNGYFSSHAAPFPVKVETLRELCGSENKVLKSFRMQLRHALDDLKACGMIVSWQIDPVTDLVNVDRGAAITDSQRRHLAKPKRQSKPKG